MAIIEPTSILSHSLGMCQPTYLISSESTVKSSGLGIVGSTSSSGSGFVVSPSGDVVSPLSASSVIASGSVWSTLESSLTSTEVISPESP